jgi:hypothetical protein
MLPWMITFNASAVTFFLTMFGLRRSIPRRLRAKDFGSNLRLR